MSREDFKDIDFNKNERKSKVESDFYKKECECGRDNFYGEREDILWDNRENEHKVVENKSENKKVYEKILVCEDIEYVEEKKCSCSPLSLGLKEVVNSISHQENGLANILENESRKISRAIDMADCVDELVKIDRSVQDTIKQINIVQMVLVEKLQEVSKICNGCDDDCKC